METHEFDIEIQPDGNVKIHVKGVKGPACEEYRSVFEHIIGKVASAEKTLEYYEPPTGVEIRIDQKDRLR